MSASAFVHFPSIFLGHPNNKLQTTKFTQYTTAFANPISINYFVQIDYTINYSAE